MSERVVIDLNKLRVEADAWLAEQPSGEPLWPCAADYWRRRFCLPTWLVEAIERDAAKDRRDA